MTGQEQLTAKRCSSNFGYLAAHDRRLSILGKQADRYVCTDPNVSMIKARQFAERLTQLLWEQPHLSAAPGLLHQRIDTLFASDAIDARTHGLLTDLRLSGNRAVHEHADRLIDAARLVQACYELGKWFHFAITDTPEPLPFVPLTPSEMGYTNRDSDPRGAYRLATLTVPYGTPSLRFALRGYVPSQGRSWAYSRERLQTLDDEGRIFWGATDTPSLKRYFADLNIYVQLERQC